MKNDKYISIGLFMHNNLNCFQVVAPINRMIELVPFDAFYYSLDWHPQDHISFIDNVKLRKLDADSQVIFS